MATNETAQAEIDRVAAGWLVRLGSPALDDADRRAFRAWLEADPAHGAAFEAARDVWAGLGVPAAALARSDRRRRRWRAGALALAGCAVAAVLILPRGADHATPDGLRRTVLLADGSRMMLDGDSAADVRVDSASRRVALLRGRAFFDVAPDPSRPFVVTAGGLEATVLGTGFAVDRGGAEVTVVVDHGRVSVRAADGASAVLTGGERVTAGATLGPPEAARPEVALAWRRGLMVFENRTLGEVVPELERAGGPIVIPQASVRALRLSGVFREDDPGAVLDAIEAGLGLRTARLGVATVIFR
ncbi:MAG: iron dicitrate transport regulator FecR [Rhodovulum sulfidophilum]|uniref:Iron dicitrate transport regulator FecR n=1 Tax=Rhodovulum sulfidophilum TaxID=35806 RepID=A0A2W5Q7K3_RHOSU|nr:MAG: iron dicitrate transport regulator FecR [Rhodovulum sulfidophilum]